MLCMLDCDFYVIIYWALPKRATQARSLVGLLPAGGATGLRCCVDSLSGWKHLGVLPKELEGGAREAEVWASQNVLVI